MARFPKGLSLFVVLVTVGALTATAQSYPSKPARIITAPVGGGNDFAARLLAQHLSPALG